MRVRRHDFFRNPWVIRHSSYRHHRERHGGYRFELMRRVQQCAAFDRRHEVQHRAARAAGETMEQIPAQVGMKGLPSYAAVDRTHAAILIAATAAQGYLVLPQYDRQRYALFHRDKIYPVAHRSSLLTSGSARDEP